jgi:hypothetical protein
MRTLRIAAAFVPLLVLSLACGVGDADRQTPEAPPVEPPQERPEAEAEAESESREAVRRISSYRLRDGRLSECADITATFVAPDPPPDNWPPAHPDLPDDEDITYIERPCEEQFSDRLVLARCAMPTAEAELEDGVRRTVSGMSYWYDAIVLTDDRLMNECVREGGQWTAIDRNSREARSAVNDQELRDAERRLEEFQRRHGR